MGFYTLVALSFALAMDAFAVSVSNGLCFKDFRKSQVVYMALTFSLFQGLMPVLGFLLGRTFASLISPFAHWLAFAILFFIGAHMLYNAARDYFSRENSCAIIYCTKKNVFFQGVATSIDAFAVGVGFALIKVNIFYAAATIAVITFFTSVSGVYLGKKFRSVIKSYAEMAGGLLLIAISFIMLFEGLAG